MTPLDPGTDDGKVAPGTLNAKLKRPPRSKKPSLSVIRAVFRATGGIVTSAADKMGVDDSTVNRWIREDPRVAELWQESRDRVVDLAESVLIKGLKNGNITCAIFVCKTIGHKRGWVENHHREVEAPARDMEAENRTLRNLWDNPQAREHINKALALSYRPAPRPASESEKVN